MAKQSLFQACKRVFRDGISGTYEVGTKNIFLELYGQEDIDGGVEIGNSSEENIVVVAGDSITIPSGYTLTPVKPKKSLVIMCNTFVNNGTVSMYQKAPNVLPHDLFIIDKSNFNNTEVIIPAYANNQINSKTTSDGSTFSINGNNGTSRNCGSGGTGVATYWSGTTGGAITHQASGSGYAFGGGAGSGGIYVIKFNITPSPQTNIYNVDTTYPMRGSSGFYNNTRADYYHVIAAGGNGRVAGTNINNSGSVATPSSVATGCGGRVIIFCNSFTNNGTINVNGCNAITFTSVASPGGASGAGAVDVFYTALLKQGTITANGGSGAANSGTNSGTSGKGGNGSITLSPWTKKVVIKPIEKYMSKQNMIYFLNQYVARLGGED